MMWCIWPILALLCCGGCGNRGRRGCGRRREDTVCDPDAEFPTMKRHRGNDCDPCRSKNCQ